MSQLKYWVWLSTMKGLKNETVVRLVEDLGTPQMIFYAEDKTLRELGYVRESEILSLSHRTTARAAEIIRLCQENNWQILTWEDEAFPQRLRQLSNPPVVLYVRGKLPEMDKTCALAMVGTRKASVYGLACAEKISGEFAMGGGVVVTGLASGIDTAAAKGALDAGGKVVGVLPCSIDLAYPKENRELIDRVAQQGAVLSEYPPTTEVLPFIFQMRNRLLSALSVGVCVMEAPAKSGALITAAKATEQSRDLFAVPGCIGDRNFEGNLHLLKDGAGLLLSGEDLIREYIAQYPGQLRLPEKQRKSQQITEEKLLVSAETLAKPLKKIIDKRLCEEYIDLVKNKMSLKPEEEAALRVLSDQPLHLDDGAEVAGLSSRRMSEALTMLEIYGAVKQLPGKLYILNLPEK